jgi:uncharacterized glyoxalase superfamily protein PhnB
MPVLTVNDVEESVAWYRDVLGFYVAQEMKLEGKLAGASLRAGAVEILLTQDDFGKGRDRRKGVGFRLYCTTAQDIDDLAEAIESRGGVLSQKPKDQSWGVRDFAVTDPDGFQISISTALPA